MKHQALIHTDIGHWGEEDIGSSEWADKPIEEIFEYNCIDSDATWRLWRYQNGLV